MTTAAEPTTLILGAGPAGLAVALGLSCHGLDDRMEVVDPSGTWLSQWHRRFRAQDIPHLRSPSVHHPHPDPFALLRHANGDGLVPSGGTQLPMTDLFARFVDEAIGSAGLHDAVTSATATAIEVDATGRPTVHLSDGNVRRPERLVLATNTRQPFVPPAFRELAQDDAATCGVGFAWGDTADVRQVEPDQHVLVVGGGLSAAHLAIGAARRGARVTVLTRRRITVRRFDTHPSWLGPKKRRPFEREQDPHVRRRAIDTARGGGSIPHRFRRTLQEWVDDGRLDLRERCLAAGTDHGPDGRTRVVCEDGHTVDADVVWLATGGAIDVTTDPLLTAVGDSHPAEIVGGLPDLDADLCWPGTRIHLAGFASALVLGPTAGNLIGHRRAAQRIVARLRGADPAQADRIATGAGACPASAPTPRRASAAGRR